MTSSLPSSAAARAPHFALTPLAGIARRLLGTGLALAAAGAAAQAVAPAAAPSGTTLGTVTVNEQAEAIGNLQKTYSGGQLARGGDLGILGRTDLMNVPFSTTNYTSELIENQQALTIADVVMNDASVRTLQARGGFGDDFQIRGFQVGSRDVSINGLYGLAPATRIPLEVIERVEVLKGPGAFTNGTGPASSIGGAINVVTKRASDTPLTRLTTTYMGKAQFGTHLDVGRRFGEDNQWGIRANGVWRNGEGNVDGGRQRVGLGSLGVDYAGARLRWSADLFHTDNKTTEFRPQATFATGAGIAAPPAVSDPRRTYYPGAVLADSAKTVISRIEYDLDERTTAYGGIGYSETDSRQNFPRTPGGIRPNGSFVLQNGYYDEDNKTSSADVGLRTRFSTGAVGHTLVLAANALQRETSSFYALGGANVASSIYNPAPLPALAIARNSPALASKLDLHSVAIADTMAFLGDRFLLTLGVRNQTVNQKSVNGSNAYNQSEITPLVGMVLKADSRTSVFYNYTAGLQPGARAGDNTANRGEVFPPQKSRQHEIGVKRDWGNLLTQAAIYQIERPSSYTDPVTNVFSFGGLQRNRGVELSAYGEVQRGLRLMASAAYNDATLVRTVGGANQGNDASGVPDSTYNLGLDWDAPWVRGLSLNGRVINTSSMWYDNANTLRMPSWTRVDLGARYATQVAGKRVVFRGSVENVADKGYWVTASGYVTVGAPRTLMLSAQVDF